MRVISAFVKFNVWHFLFILIFISSHLNLSSLVVCVSVSNDFVREYDILLRASYIEIAYMDILHEMETEYSPKLALLEYARTRAQQIFILR